MKRNFLLMVAFLMTATLLAIPRAEYPRPQFERQDWVNLNGDWTYTFDFVGSGMEKHLHQSQGFADKITVPFCPESKLSGVGYTDFINHIWYQRSITMPQAWSGKRVRLNFGAVYYNSEIFIVGKLAGRHFGGSTSFVWISHALWPTERHTRWWYTPTATHAPICNPQASKTCA